MKRLFVVLLSVLLVCVESVWAAPCPPCTSTYGFRGLNSVRRSTPDIVGTKAYISFHDVQLCNENEWDPAEEQSRPYNHSAVWTMIVGTNTNVSQDEDNVYIQTGWIRMNHVGLSAADFVFFEAGTQIGNDANGLRFTHENAIPSGTKLYKLEQSNKADGTWEAYYKPNTAPWETHDWSIWRNINGNFIQNQGEVNKLESDMAGLSNNKCVLKGLQYQYEGNQYWHDQDTEATTFGNTTEFGAHKESETEVHIWDKQDDCN